MMSDPGAHRISSVTTFDDDLSVLYSIKQADTQSFILADYLWTGVPIAIMRARTHNRNFRPHSG
jgi:hypothetical protein